MTDTKPVEPGKEHEGRYRVKYDKITHQEYIVDSEGFPVELTTACAMLNAEQEPMNLKAIMRSIYRKSFIVTSQDYGREVIFPDWVQVILENAKPAPASLPVQGLARIYNVWSKSGNYTQAFDRTIRKTLTDLGVKNLD